MRGSLSATPQNGAVVLDIEKREVRFCKMVRLARRKGRSTLTFSLPHFVLTFAIPCPSPSLLHPSLTSYPFYDFYVTFHLPPLVSVLPFASPHPCYSPSLPLSVLFPLPPLVRVIPLVRVLPLIRVLPSCPTPCLTSSFPLPSFILSLA